MVRWQATRHCAFVMCVSRSQKPMQSASVLPPPPGVLGAVELELPGDRAKLPLPPAAAPLVENCVGRSGERGAMAGAVGAGVPIIEGADVEGVDMRAGVVARPDAAVLPAGAVPARPVVEEPRGAAGDVLDGSARAAPAPPERLPLPAVLPPPPALPPPVPLPADAATGRNASARQAPASR